MSEAKQQTSQPRPRKQHELKTWPEFFEATRNGKKRFELRRNDRDFQVGDELLLKEWDPKAEYGSSADNTEPVGYTGRAVIVRVDYIMGVDDLARLGVDESREESGNWLIMSTSLVN